jgi:hypothetical protein
MTEALNIEAYRNAYAKGYKRGLSDGRYIAKDNYLARCQIAELLQEMTEGEYQSYTRDEMARLILSWEDTSEE